VDTSASRATFGRRAYLFQLWSEVDSLVVLDYCDAVVNAYQQPRATLNLWLPAALGGETATAALALRVSDRIALRDAQTGLDGEAMVEQLEYVHQDGELLVRLGCEQTSSAAANYLVWDVGRWDVDRWGF
jgi:hypothetical protein